MSNPIPAKLQIIELLLDEHHRTEYAVRTWVLTEQQRRSIAGLLGKPDAVVFLPADAIHAATAAAAQMGLIVIEKEAP